MKRIGFEFSGLSKRIGRQVFCPKLAPAIVRRHFGRWWVPPRGLAHAKKRKNQRRGPGGCSCQFKVERQC